MEYYFDKKLNEAIDEFYCRLNKDREILSKESCLNILSNLENYCIDIDKVRNMVGCESDLISIFTMLTQMSITEMIHIKTCENCGVDNEKDNVVELIESKCNHCGNKLWKNVDMDSEDAYGEIIKTVYIIWQPIIWEICECGRQVYDIRKDYCFNCELDEKFPSLKGDCNEK